MFAALIGSNVGGSSWPPDSSARCSQNTKQKAMYGKMSFSPSLSKKPLTSMEVDVEWNDLRFNPISNPKKQGGVYISYTTGLENGVGGYLGVQINARGGQFLFSFWDNDRFSGSGHNLVPKKASQLVWPVDHTLCKRNCQDCGLPSLEKFIKTGLTTGTQCIFQSKDIKVGDKFKVVLKQIKKVATIHTTFHGGMSKALKEAGERNRVIRGGLWEVKIQDIKRKKWISVGTMIMEGDGSGMDRLGTFDEMIGCRKCNAVHHKDTRYGPKITAADRSIRYPTKMEGKTRSADSTCKNYSIKGSKADMSISFESGPFVKDIFPYNGRYQPVW